MLDVIDRAEATLHAAQTTEILLGDYVDRGPQSSEVIELLRTTTNPERQRICLLGNHEQMLLRFMGQSSTWDRWRSMGAISTLASYGVSRELLKTSVGPDLLHNEFHKIVPTEHLAFLMQMPVHHRIGDYFFVHAGLRPRVPLERQTQQDMLWIRSEFVRSEHDFGLTVVHGHTPSPDAEVLPNRIGVDTGAYATGHLSCVMLENETATVFQVGPVLDASSDAS